MKTMIFTAVIVLFSVISARATTGVASQVFGYSKVEAQANTWHQIATPFEVIDSTAEEGKVKINEVYTTGFDVGDLLYVYDSQAGGYSKLYSWQECYFDEDWNLLPNAPILAWGSGESFVTDTVDVGQAVFIQKITSNVMVFLGNVSEDAVSTFGSESGNTWKQIALLYPAVMSLNDMTWTGIAFGDLIYLYDSILGAYTIYNWSECLVEGDPTWTLVVIGWSRDNCFLTNEPIAVGQGLFIKKISTGIGTLSR